MVAVRLLVVLLLVRIGVARIGGGGRVVRVARRMCVDVASVGGSSVAVLLSCCSCVRVVMGSVVVLLLVVLLCRRRCVRVTVGCCRRRVVMSRGVVVLPSCPSRRDGRPPVRQRRVHQVVHRLEQVLDAVRGGDPGVTQVRYEFGGDVVDGHVGHGLSSLGRGQGGGHLVLEEAGERGGHGAVAVRVGDALVLLLLLLFLG